MVASLVAWEQEDQELFNKHFAKFVAEGLSGDDMEDLYTKVGPQRISMPCLIRTFLSRACASG